MRIQLSDHFNYSKLLKFVLPSILMMICTSVYSVVDGLFVSNFVGKTHFAAINLTMPFIMAVVTIGFMIGTGGSAIVAKTLGEGKKEKANEYFTMLICLTVILGIAITILGLLFLRPIIILLGAEGILIEYCMMYGKMILISMTAFMLQTTFQSFFIVAEKPALSLKISIAAGLTNMILDFVFIVIFHWGLAGAAAATMLGQVVGGVIPLFYFSKKNSSLLHFKKFIWNVDVIWKTCTNGSSEMMTNLSASVVNILYNYQLMKIAGENGISAYGVIMYVNFTFTALFIGYSIGSAPIFSYHYGAGNDSELQNLFQKSLKLTAISSIVLTVLAEVVSLPLTSIFVGYDKELLDMTCNGFRVYALSFTISGFNIFSSGFFTALNNGFISAFISFTRTLLFQLGAVLILPFLIGLNGIWLAIVVAELLALFVSIFFFVTKRKQYHY
ncbi:MATE family efflux transporter [Lachnospiraceae bacterium 46-61]